MRHDEGRFGERGGDAASGCLVSGDVDEDRDFVLRQQVEQGIDDVVDQFCLSCVELDASESQVSDRMFDLVEGGFRNVRDGVGIGDEAVGKGFDCLLRKARGLCG